MNPVEFLIEVWRDQPEGYGCVAFGNKARGLWQEVFYPISELHAIVLSAPDEADVYFCPLTFYQKKRRKEYVLKSRWLYADLDEAPLDKLPLKPTHLWRTSNGRHQALWGLADYVEPQDLEKWNRLMTNKSKADKSGWDLTQLLRIPGTHNYKRSVPEDVVLL